MAETLDTDTPQQNKITDLVCLGGLTSGLVVTLICAYVMPEASRFWVYATVFSRLFTYWGASRTRAGRIYAELVGMGLIAGAWELLADYFLIHWIKSGRLLYPPGDAILLDSPLWMPLAWACVVTELGYVTLRLARIGKRPWIGTLIGALMAGVTIGLYEFFAHKAGWWSYAPAKWMIGAHCALYIPLGEVLMFLAFYPIFTRTQVIKDGTLRAIVRGSLFGAAIFISYALAYGVLEGM